MRFLFRNATSTYAVYAAAIVSGVVVTPIIVHSLGKTGWGVWSFIGSVTIYLSILDFGVGPSIVRFGAEARGRAALEDINELASSGLAIYAVIGLLTLPVGLVLAWFVPGLLGVHGSLATDARVATILVVVGLAARFPLGLFNNLLNGQQRWDVTNLGNFVATVVYAVLVAVLMPHHGGLVLVGLLTLCATVLRLALPLLWLRRELPGLTVRRRYVSRARVRELLAFSSSNFLVHIAQKIAFSTDVVVIGIVLGARPAGVYNIPANLFALAFGLGTAATSLMLPAFAELEGSGELQRQRRLLVTGMRGGIAVMLVLALPLLLIPDLLIHGWLGNDQYRGGYGVMAVLAGVLLIHQPIYVFTQFLIARARQREVAFVSIVTATANLVLSIVLAWTWGIEGVAVATLAMDVVALVWIVPRYVAPAASVPVQEIAVAGLQPLAAVLPATVVFLVVFARLWSPQTLPSLAVVGVAWAAAAGASLWWLGLPRGERAALRRHLRPTAAQPAGT